MIIHVIEPDDTIETISNYYGVSSEWIVRENGVLDPNNLTVGATLVILYPRVTHIIVEGDTLGGIAELYSVTVMDLLRNNSYLANQEYLIVGDTIVIEYEDEKINNITTIGYCYPFIEEDILRKTLPFLTYVIIYSYVIGSEGQFYELDDALVIEYSKTYGVAPVMIISFETTELISETDIVHLILNNENLRNSLIESIINSLISKEYLGLSISPVYVYPSDRQLYVEFMNALTSRVKDLGLILFDTLLPRTYSLIADAFELQEYTRIVNQMVDSSIVFPVMVGITVAIPFGDSNYETIRGLLDNFLVYNSPDTVQIGINNVGYMWELPYIPGISQGHSIAGYSAIRLARDNEIPILFDDRTKSAYFIYSEDNKEYLVKFSDARTMDSYLDAVNDYDLNGIGVWNIMSYFNSLWLMVNAQYYIDKVEV